MKFENLFEAIIITRLNNVCNASSGNLLKALSVGAILCSATDLFSEA